MHLHRSGVEREGLDLDAHDLFHLQFLEDSIEYAALGPTVHARVNGVPAAEALRKPTPLAALFSHIKNSVEHLQIGQTYIAALHRQALLDARVLLFGDLHLSNILRFYCLYSVNTP